MWQCLSKIPFSPLRGDELQHSGVKTLFCMRNFFKIYFPVGKKWVKKREPVWVCGTTKGEKKEDSEDDWERSLSNQGRGYQGARVLDRGNDQVHV